MADAAMLLAHFEKMQNMATRYCTPERYVDREGRQAINQCDADSLFAADMVYMLDGPEQRAAQFPQPAEPEPPSTK